MRDFVQLEPSEPLQVVNSLVWIFWDAEADSGGRAGLVCRLRPDQDDALTLPIDLVAVDASTSAIAAGPDALVLRSFTDEETAPAPAWLAVRLDDGALVLPPDASWTARALGERFASLLIGPVLDAMYQTARVSAGLEVGFKPIAWEHHRPGWQVFWSDVSHDARPDVYALPDGSRVLADPALCPDPKCGCARFMVRFHELDASGERRWLGDADVAYDPEPIELAARDIRHGPRLRAAWDAFATRYPTTEAFAESTRALRAWAGPQLPRRRARVDRDAPCPCGSGDPAGRCCHADPRPEARWSA